MNEEKLCHLSSAAGQLTALGTPEHVLIADRTLGVVANKELMSEEAAHPL